MSEETSRTLEKLERVLTEMSGEFDTVRIFVTRHDGSKGTYALSRGRGNIYAQYGHVREWLLTMDAITKSQAKQEDEQ